MSVEGGDNWHWGGNEILKHILEELIGGFIKFIKYYTLGFPGGSDGKESACIAGDPGLIPGSGRSPGERNGNPLQYPWLEIPMEGGAWQATYSPWGHKESEQLHFHFTFMHRKTWKEKHELIVEFIDCITSRTGYRCLTYKNCTYVCQKLAWRIIFKSFVNGGINIFLR